MRSFRRKRNHLGFIMKASAGRPTGSGGDVTAGVRNGQLINQRIRALVGQALDELERRRAKGRSDVVAKLADQIEKDPITALRSLQDLLPKDDVAGKAPTLNMQALFVQASREMSESMRNQRDTISPTAPLLDVMPRAEPMRDVEPVPNEIEW